MSKNAWSSRPLRECGEICSGGTPNKSRPDFWSGNLPWFSSKEIRSFTLSDTELHVHPTATKGGTTLVPEGTILFVVRGMSLAREFRVGVTTRPSTFNQDVKALIPAPNVDGRYLARYLRWMEPKILASTESSTHGTKRLPSGVFESLSIPLPPLPEQRRIADILDKADAIRRKRKEAIALTEELLRSTFLEMFGDPVTNPKGWPVKPLGELVDIIGGGTPSRSRPDYFQGEIPWATAKDFKGDMMADTEEHVSKQAINDSTTQLVTIGTILVVVKSKILMRRLPVSIAQIPLCFNQDVKGLIPRNPGESAFIAAHMRIAQHKLLGLARGANTEGLTVNHLKSHTVMRPPAALIEAFAKLDSQIRKTLLTMISTVTYSKQLFASLTQRTLVG